MQAAPMKSIKWLTKRQYPPYIYLFRHLERGQVVYSQTPFPTKQDIENLWPQPNQINKKPVYGTRRDLWKLMCLVQLPKPEWSLQLYRDLIHLRHLRDIKGINTYRELNYFGQVWYSGQYRPVYAQEAIADLRECLLKGPVGTSNNNNNNKDDNTHLVTIYWEDLWRMGDKEKYWSDILPQVEHKQISRIGNMSREESGLLKLLGRNQNNNNGIIANINNAASQFI